MSIFQYNAVNNKGQTVKDKIEAFSSEDAISKIRALGYYPTNVKEIHVRKKTGETATTATREPSKKRRGISISFGKVKSKELTTFTRQIATLQDAGLPIIRGLKILTSQTRGLFKKTLLNVIEDIEGGNTLSGALQDIKGL